MTDTPRDRLRELLDAVLDEDNRTLDDMAGDAYASPYHFSRLLSRDAGEPPVTGPTPHLVLAGVSTDCCVISTALAAADAGATITVVTDACAGSTPENHRSAMDVMALYPPQITLATTDEVLS